ncbi:MAG: RDD family protein [Bacteroidota bacterium]
MNSINSAISYRIPNFVLKRNLLNLSKPNSLNLFKWIKHKSNKAPNLEVDYAGLGARLFATLIDLFIVYGSLLIIEKLLILSNIININEINHDAFNYRYLIYIFAWILYNGILESSVYQATFGEQILKLKVIDLYGKRMGFIKATARCIYTIFSFLSFGLGIWYITLDPKKQSWHDLIVGSYVIKT